MATYTVANITDITGNADWTFDASNNQIGATGVGLSIGAPSDGPVADSVNISGSYLINNVSVTAGLAPLASPTFTGTVTAPILDVTGAATFSSTLAVTGTTTLSDGLAVTGIVNATGGFEIGGNSIYTSPALTGSPTAPTQAAADNSTKIATTAFVTTAVSNIVGSPNQNKLINAFMEIDQANEGASVSLTSGTPSYIVDGWQAEFGGASGAVVSAQRVPSAPTGYPNSLKITVSTGGTFAASSFLYVRQPVEADNLVDTGFGASGAQSLGLTFWLISSISGVYSGAIQNYANTRSYPFNVTLSAANTWQKFTVIIPGDTGGTWVSSGSGGGLYLIIAAVGGTTFQGTPNAWAFANTFATSSNTNSLLSTSGATFQVGPAKLEVSTAVTPLVQLQPQQNLALCQRYYEKSYNPGTAPGTASSLSGSFSWLFPVGTSGQISVRHSTKRIQPTVSTYSASTGTIGDAWDASNSVDRAINLIDGGNNGFIAQLTSPPAVICLLQMHWVADARL